MSEGEQQFYNGLINYIENENNARFVGTSKNGNFLFSNVDTGKFVLNTDIWQYWDDLRAERGTDGAKAAIGLET